MKSWLAWTMGVAMLVVAWGVVQVTPAEDDAQAGLLRHLPHGLHELGR